MGQVVHQELQVLQEQAALQVQVEQVVHQELRVLVVLMVLQVHQELLVQAV